MIVCEALTVNVDKFPDVFASMASRVALLYARLMASVHAGTFQQDATRARDLSGWEKPTRTKTYERVDAADLFRPPLVQSVAASDAYVHGRASTEPSISCSTGSRAARLAGRWA